MKISVIIPAYNCEATIQETLDSVLGQTVAPDEILVLDDGSTDCTPELLASYRPRITVFRQKNGGVASARNALCERAQGDLVAFLDSDDIWHPRYLEVQRELFQQHPTCVAFFTGHVNFYGGVHYVWKNEPLPEYRVEIIPRLEFLVRYNSAVGRFLPSYGCVPKKVLRSLGPEPFKGRIAEDVYFVNLVLLVARRGCILYASIPLGAYRIRSGTLSSNHLAITEAEVRAFELLESYHRTLPDRRFSRALNSVFAMKRRQYAKRLLGVGQMGEAGNQLRHALRNSGNPISLAKCLRLLLLSYLPKPLQPKWPPPYRELSGPQSASLDEGT